MNILAPKTHKGFLALSALFCLLLTATATDTRSSLYNIDAPPTNGEATGTTTVCPANNSGVVQAINYTGSVVAWHVSFDGFATFTNLPTTYDNLGYTDITESRWYRAALDNGELTTPAIITVEDNAPPVLDNCPNAALQAFVELNSCGANVVLPSITASDDCAGPNLPLSATLLHHESGNTQTINLPNASHFFSAGTNTVTYSADDGNGNSASCTFDVVVLDTIAPEIDNIGDQDVYMTTNCEYEMPDYTGTFVSDNCSGATITLQIPSPGTLLNGDTTVLLTGADQFGLVDSLWFDVTFIDTLPPVMPCTAHQTFPLLFPNCSALMPQVYWYDPDTHCDIANITQTPEVGIFVIPGDYDVVVVYEDHSGNTSICETTVTFVDMYPPQVVLCPDPVSIPTGMDCGAIIPDLTDTTHFIGTDCGDTLVPVQTPAPGTIVYNNTVITLTITDQGNNTDSSCQVPVTLFDGAAPVLECPNDTILLLGAGACTAQFDPLAGVEMTDCSGANVISDAPSGNLFPLGSTIVTVTAEDLNGLESTCSYAVNVVDMVNLILQYPLNSVCTMSNSLLTPAVSLAGGEFSSTAGLDIDPNTGAIDPSGSQPGTYDIFYIIDNGCADSATFTIEIVDQMDAGFTYPANIFCTGALNPTPTPLNLGGVFESSPAGLTIDPSTGEIDLATSVAGQYTISHYIDGGCSDTVYVQITIENGTDASFDYAQHQFCVGGADQDPINVADPNGTFFELTGTLIIDPNTGTIDMANSPAGAYDVLHVTNGNCPDSVTVAINLLDEPIAEWTAGGPYCESQGILDLSTLLDPGADPNGTWGGNGVNGNELDLLQVSDSVEVTYEVGNGDCFAAHSAWILVDNMPVADAGTPQIVCGSSTQMNATGQGTWSSSTLTFDDTTDPTTTAHATNYGTQLATWTVENGACSVNADVQITFDEEPTVAEAGSDTTICVDEYQMMANTPLVGSGEWILLSGSGNIQDPSSPTTNVTGLGLGINEFKWKISNGSCDYSFNLVNIEVIETPNAEWNAPQDHCAADGVLDLAPLATVSGGTWSWAGGGGNLFDPSGFNGPVEITYTIGGIPCQANEMHSINFWQSANASFDPFDVVCSDAAPFDLNANLTGDQGGSWTIQGTPSNGMFDPSGLNGNIPVEYTVGASGCESSAQGFIQVMPAVSANTGNDDEICGLEYQLSANADPTSVWSGPAGAAFSPSASAANATVSVTTYGSHIFSWTVDNGVCNASSDVQITFYEPIDPNSVFAGEDQEVLSGDGTTLNANTPPVGTGTWSSPDDGIWISDPNDPNSAVTDLPIGITTMIWSVNNGPCEGFSDEMEIEVHEFFIPEGFSPNNDGTNDLFEITGIERFPENEFSVFDRWGKRVYNSNGYNNEWDGLSDKGLTLPDDTYFYVLNLTGVTAYNGYVIIKR